MVQRREGFGVWGVLVTTDGGVFFLLRSCFCHRFDVAFNLLLTHLEPVCREEQKFCVAFFHFPRSELSAQMDDSAEVRMGGLGRREGEGLVLGEGVHGVQEGSVKMEKG